MVELPALDRGNNNNNNIEQQLAAAQNQSVVSPQDMLREISPEEQQILADRKISFCEARGQIQANLDQALPQIEQEKCPDVTRQMVSNCFISVLNTMLGVLPFSESMRLLARATQDLSDSQAQPQDVHADIDFYGQVERLAENFVTDVRRVEIQRDQQEGILLKQRRDSESKSRALLDQLEHKEKLLMEELGDQTPGGEEMLEMLREQQKKLSEDFEQKCQIEAQLKADAIKEVETKEKVIESLTRAFQKQKNVLCETKLAFNFDKAVKDVRAGLTHFGAPRDHRAVCKQSQWPYLEALKNPELELFEQEQLLSEMRVIKIEWTVVDVICTLRFHFSNGTASPQLGQKVPLQENHTLKQGQEIKKIYICVRRNMDYLEAMVLVDQNEQLICKFAGDSVTGDWETLELGPGEQVIGIKANMCDRFCRGIGFFLWKPGMGLLNN